MVPENYKVYINKGTLFHTGQHQRKVDKVSDFIIWLNRLKELLCKFSSRLFLTE